MANQRAGIVGTWGEEHPPGGVDEMLERWVRARRTKESLCCVKINQADDSGASFDRSNRREIFLRASVSCFGSCGRRKAATSLRRSCSTTRTTQPGALPSLSSFPPAVFQHKLVSTSICTKLDRSTMDSYTYHIYLFRIRICP